jgi:hypothetical protein
LVGKGLDQGDLLFREGSDLQAVNNHYAQYVIAFEDRYPEHCPDRLDGFYAVRILRIGGDIGNMDRSAFERGTGRRTIRTGTKRMVLNPLHSHDC